jgi:hypothetical protein
MDIRWGWDGRGAMDAVGEMESLALSIIIGAFIRKRL